MPPIEESRERQRLYAPSRSSLHRAAPAAGRKVPGADGPWASDTAWPPGGQAPDYAEPPDKAWWIRGLLFAAIVLANVELASESSGIRALVVVLDVCGVVLLLDALLRLLHILRKGVLRMRWKTFPVFLGGR